MRAILLIVLLMPSTALAQGVPLKDSLWYGFVSAGVGSVGDDEGGLGHGMALVGGFGAGLGAPVDLEVSLARTHHERAGAIAWDGDATSVTGRLRYSFGLGSSPSSVFLGGGVGYTHYPGAITEQFVNPSNASTPPGGRYAFTLAGFSYEGGVGLQIPVSRRAFVRPEAWVTIANASRTSGTRSPEPPLFIARATIGAGWRF